MKTGAKRTGSRRGLRVRWLVITLRDSNEGVSLALSA